MEVKILTKKSYFSDWSYDRTDEARSFVRRWSMMTFSWKCCMRMLKMLHSGCTLVRHFQPRVHHIWMLHSLPCIICILYPLQGLTNVVFVSICTAFLCWNIRVCQMFFTFQLSLVLGSPHIFYSCGEDGVVYQVDLRQEKPNKWAHIWTYLIIRMLLQDIYSVCYRFCHCWAVT